MNGISGVSLYGNNTNPKANLKPKQIHFGSVHFDELSIDRISYASGFRDAFLQRFNTFRSELNRMTTLELTEKGIFRRNAELTLEQSKLHPRTFRISAVSESGQKSKVKAKLCIKKNAKSADAFGLATRLYENINRVVNSIGKEATPKRKTR